MLSYVVSANRNLQVRNALAFKGEAQTIQFDFSPWEDDNGSVSSVTWEVKSGNASISNESLSSSIASMTLTTSDTGSSMIKLTATAGNNTFVTHLRVLSKDPDVITEDYGLIH